MNRPALHIHIDRDDMGLWEDSALGLAQGASFFASAIRRRHEEIFQRQPPIVREVDHVAQREAAYQNMVQHGIAEGVPYIQ